MAIDPGIGPETGARLARGVALIVLAGVALGVGFNALQRLGGSERALAWIGREEALASLEDLQDASPAPGAANAPGTMDAPEPAPPAAAERAPAIGPPPAGTSSSAAARQRPPGTPPARSGTGPAAGARSQTAAAGETAPAPQPQRPDLPSIPDTPEPLEIQYATAKKFLDAGAAVFVDARSRAEYEEGHIPGAQHLSADAAVEDPSITARLETDGRPIITYCSSADCNLSRDLAFALIEGGHRKVLVYTAGIAGWQAEGQPLVPGRAPGGEAP